MKMFGAAFAAALVVAPRLAAATTSADELVLSKETLTEAQCSKVVKKVEEKGKYTEDSIMPICSAEVKSSKCDFFAEALSLASSHSDFDAKVFCRDIAEAHFCSQTMDHLLTSATVSDLAFGECIRAKESKGEAYCLKFQKMLSYAVQNDDLDTMRACYMIEAYEDLGDAKHESGNKTASPKPEAKPRIVTSSSKELEDAGSGSAATPAPEEKKEDKKSITVGKSGIVLQPQPLESIGEGKANPNHGNAQAKPQEKPAEAKPVEAKQESTIITDPQPMAKTGKDDKAEFFAHPSSSAARKVTAKAVQATPVEHVNLQKSTPSGVAGVGTVKKQVPKKAEASAAHVDAAKSAKTTPKPAHEGSSIAQSAAKFFDTISSVFTGRSQAAESKATALVAKSNAKPNKTSLPVSAPSHAAHVKAEAPAQAAHPAVNKTSMAKRPKAGLAQQRRATVKQARRSETKTAVAVKTASHTGSASATVSKEKSVATAKVGIKGQHQLKVKTALNATLKASSESAGLRAKSDKGKKKEDSDKYSGFLSGFVS